MIIMGINMKNKAYKKIEEYIRRSMKQGEIGGLLLGKIKKDGDINVTNAILLKQLKTASHFEIDEEALMDITKNWSGKQLASIIGWWHSHCNFGTFWSPTDSDTFARLCDLSGFCVGVVAAFRGKKMNMRWRMQLRNKDNIRMDIDDINPHVERGFDNYVVKVHEIMEDIKENVFEDERIWVDCPTCNGTGVLEEKEYEDYVFTEEEEKYNKNIPKQKKKKGKGSDYIPIQNLWRQDDEDTVYIG